MKLWIALWIGLVITGCQQSTPKTVASSTAHSTQFLQDVARIDAFTDAHPWASEEVSGDIDEALIEVEDLKRRGPAYLLQRDKAYAFAIEAQNLANERRVRRESQYRNEVAARKNKTYQGSFIAAWLKLFRVDHVLKPAMQSEVNRSGIQRGIYELDATFVVSGCEGTVCMATAMIPPNDVPVRISALLPRRPSPGDVITPALIEVLGADSHGDLVVAVVGPLNP